MRMALDLAREAESAGRSAGWRHVVVWTASCHRTRAELARLYERSDGARGNPGPARSGGGRSATIVWSGATLYATLEPCVMCAGALVAARISRLVFGARDLRFGGVRSKFRLADSEVLNHRVEIVEGVLAAECTNLIQRFFSNLR